MDRDELTDTLGHSRDERKGTVLMNIKFRSLQRFLFYMHELHDFFGDVTEFAPEQGRTVNAFDSVSKTDEASYDSFIVWGGEFKHRDAFRICGFPSKNDGWALLQYSSTDAQRALDFAWADFPEMQALFAESYKVSFHSVEDLLVGRNEADIMGHFDQKVSRCHHNFGSKRSPLSAEVIGLFNDKGWNLYNIWNEIKDPTDFAKVVSEGPVQELVIGRRYKVVPSVEHPRYDKDVKREIKKMKKEKMLPLFGGKDGYWADTIKLTPNRFEAQARNRTLPFTIYYPSLAKGVRTGLSQYLPQTATD